MAGAPGRFARCPASRAYRGAALLCTPAPGQRPRPYGLTECTVSYDFILTETDGRVATITLNRPES